MQKITPFLWFNDNAEQAVNYYMSIFKDARITGIHDMGEQVLTIGFELFGISYTALNGGPMYSISEGVSFVILCQDQAEIDYYWEKLGDGGKIMQCGWLTDKFGVTWQVIPHNLPQLISNPDKEKAARAMQAMMKMVKLDIAGLENA